LIGFDLARGGAYVRANNGRDTRSLLRIDERTGEVLETLHSDPDYDVTGPFLRHRRDGTPIMIGYQQDRYTERWFDPVIEARMQQLRSVIPGQPARVRIVSASNDAERLVLRTEGNGSLPSHYLFDAAAQRLVLLGRAYSQLESAVEPVPVSYRARDGMTIPGYLTTPRQGEAPFATVVVPHGGPYLRTTEDFDYWTQFLVSRGYAVFQPDYRGSAGYGDRFLSAGFEQWGLAMQDDLIDGLDWLIDEGVADRDRVCFVGGSYGGYAALVAAYRTPDRIHCAVSFAGLTDLVGLVARLRLFRLGELTIAHVPAGEARTEASPVHQAHRVGVPLLLVHGDVDRSVVVDQSRAMADALEAAGKPFRYIEQPNGDHFLSLASHRLEFLEALDDFLNEHLQAR
jgi:dipeptidyl aminopeptidase/acylaminoacyl peptidase